MDIPYILDSKNDERVRWISDFCHLNKLLKRPCYFLPIIPAIMQKRASFSHITKLDNSMGFYTFELDSHTQQYCVIITSFGFYQYVRLPMGLTNSPDVFQSVMHPSFQDIPSVECSIDDIGVFTNSDFDHHLSIVKQVLLRLEESGFTINPLKCDWAVQSTNYLCFFLMADGINLSLKKLRQLVGFFVLRHLRTHVRSFVGLINYYKDMWPRRAHILAPFNELCGAKRKFTWTGIHENSFNLAKKLIAEDVLLRFPNHKLPFEIYTDANNFQIGATLLSNSTTNNRIFRWKQKIQEFSPTLIYVKGQCNVEADALCRLPMDIQAHEIMLNHPPVDPHNPLFNKHPLDLKYIQSNQDQDAELQKVLMEDPKFVKSSIHEVDLIHYKSDEFEKPKIVIPNAIQLTAIRWMHSLLDHAGITRLSSTFRKHFWFPQMNKAITQLVQKCEYCQCFNKQTIKYGHVPPKQIKHLCPWEEVSVDMIGPWKISMNKFEYQFRALTCIDTIIGLPEVIPVDNATSKSVAIAFEDNWLSRYPAPLICLHDNGNEFLGPAFSSMLARNKIKSVPTTVKNPQSNAIVERMHHSISTMIAISLYENHPVKYEDVSNLVFSKCMSAQYAVRSTVNRSLKHTPGELGFWKRYDSSYS